MPLRDIPACLRARLSRLIALQSRDREGAGFDTGCEVDFMLDVTRATIRLTKATYQNRARQAIILMRLDLDGPPHSNPDALPSIGNYPWLEPYKGKTVPCPHLHRYVENFGDKWAIPAPIDRYPNVQDLYSTLEAFMVHCNITEPPRIEKGLFS